MPFHWCVLAWLAALGLSYILHCLGQHFGPKGPKPSPPDSGPPGPTSGDAPPTILPWCLPYQSHSAFSPPRPHPHDFDSSLRSTLGEILQCPICDEVWTQATLPFNGGGLGLRSASRSAPTAFVSCCNMSKSLALQVLPSLAEGHELTFPGETPTIQVLISLINSTNDPAQSLDLSSQSILHKALDNHLYHHLFSTLDFCNQARLKTLSADTSTSSWLKAPPLGLALSGPEFIIASRHWLGIPHLPPSTPLLCPCSNHLDQFGDHILGCSHGPYRIKRHDALRDVLYHTLRQDNPNVLLEQKVSGDSGSRRGDIFHPEFDHGKATYFDVSVHSSLQPSNITRATHTAGVAAATGELLKDSQHQATVEASGGSFIPLVVESLGLWTPFAKKTLKSIATRSAVVSLPILLLNSYSSNCHPSFGPRMPE